VTHVVAARAVRAVHDGALIDEDVKRLLAGRAVVEQRLGVVSELKAEGWVPQQVEAEVGDQIDHVRLVRVQERHRVPAARTTLEPQY
jgi:hypothetical protein